MHLAVAKKKTILLCVHGRWVISGVNAMSVQSACPLLFNTILLTAIRCPDVIVDLVGRRKVIQINSKSSSHGASII